MTPTEACIALNMLPTVGPVRLRKLLEVFKSPERILMAKRGELRGVEGIGNEVAEQISNWEATVDLAAELVRDKATKQPVELVHAVLVAHNNGDPLNRIAKNVDRHHTAVKRIIDAAEARVDRQLAATG